MRCNMLRSFLTLLCACASSVTQTVYLAGDSTEAPGGTGNGTDGERPKGDRVNPY